MRNLLLYISIGLACSCTVKTPTSSEQSEIKSTTYDSILTNNQTEIKTKDDIKMPTVRVSGTEPFWNFNIKQDTFLFTFLTEKADSAYFTLDSFTQSENHIAYYLKDVQAVPAVLKLMKTGKCSDGMSDKIYLYEASFYYKRMTLNGCAENQ